MGQGDRGAFISFARPEKFCLLLCLGEETGNRQPATLANAFFANVQQQDMDIDGRPPNWSVFSRGFLQLWRPGCGLFEFQIQIQLQLSLHPTSHILLPNRTFSLRAQSPRVHAAPFCAKMRNFFGNSKDFWLADAANLRRAGVRVGGQQKGGVALRQDIWMAGAVAVAGTMEYACVSILSKRVLLAALES